MDGAVAIPGAAPRPRLVDEPLLPPLREDLQLVEAAPGRDGAPRWTIHDPVTNRFYAIGWLERELLARWPLGRASLVLARLERETPLAAGAEEIVALVAFLKQHQLIRASTPEDVKRMASIAARSRESKLTWLLHNYLFFRLPLVRPQAFLQATLPLVTFFYSRWFAAFVLIATLCGVALAARQWDTFAATFVDTLTLSGLAGYAVALAFAKALHELGHAYTATRLGTRVAHMGIAFIVLWPMLYTDTSESWRLADRKARLRIAGAGIAVELALAGLCTLAWSLADDGPVKSALFFLATTSWVLTLGINASPFMRFDGYFLACDALDLPNLHERSFALARAALRRGLLGIDERDPEAFSPGMRRFLIAFAWTTWLYRLVVFFGIALAVYYLFFKLAGIFLFAVEIGWFIVRPVWREMQVWGKRRAEIGFVRVAVLLVLLGGIGALLAVPWSAGIVAPAWLRAAEQQVVYSPLPARLERVRAPGRVEAGEILAVLDSPDARSKAAQAQVLAEALGLQLDRSVGRDDGAERRQGFAEELAQQLAELRAQRAELKRLELRAPYAGTLTDAEPWIRPGTWMNARQPIALLVDERSWIVEAFVDQRALERVRVGDRARFLPTGQTAGEIAGEIVAVDRTRVVNLPSASLAADHGGPIATFGAGEQKLAPRAALYRVRIAVERPVEPRVRIGSVRIDGEARSLIGGWWRDLAAVLVRESGF